LLPPIFCFRKIMKVLMLSTDENIFKEDSEARKRMVDYGGLVGELRIVIKSKNNKDTNFNNIFIYSTNSSNWFYFFRALKIGKKIIEKDGQWLITTQDPFETGLVGYMLKRKFKLPWQIQIHTDFLSPYFGGESIKNKVRVLLAKWLIQKSNNIRVVSERIKTSLCSKLQVPGSKIAVLPIWVDIEKIKNSHTETDLHKKYPGRFIILMASRLTKEKNIGLAIEVLKEIAKKHPEVLLLIVGSGPESEKIKSQVIDYKLQDFVVFESWNNDLVSYYKTADLFLLASNYEGYGRTVIEAMAASLPVVMTDVGIGMGLVARVGDESDLAEKILGIISSSEKRKQVLEEQDKFFRNWPTKLEYLSKIKQLWQECFL